MNDYDEIKSFGEGIKIILTFNLKAFDDVFNKILFGFLYFLIYAMIILVLYMIIMLFM